MQNSNSARFITYILAAIVFVACGLYIVCYAAGYKIDFVNREIKQTAMIDVQADDLSEVMLDNKSVGFGRKILRDIEPGSYNIEVKKPGYYPWYRTVELSAGQASILNDVILFKQGISAEQFNSEVNSDSLTKLSDTDNITVSKGEIYQNGQFVTRLSSDVTGACWYTDRRYIAFTAGGKLNIIEIDGTNQVELLTKTSNSPAIFVNSGKSVIFENDNKILQAQIK